MFEQCHPRLVAGHPYENSLALPLVQCVLAAGRWSEGFASSATLSDKWRVVLRHEPCNQTLISPTNHCLTWSVCTKAQPEGETDTQTPSAHPFALFLLLAFLFVFFPSVSCRSGPYDQNHIVSYSSSFITSLSLSFTFFSNVPSDIFISVCFLIPLKQPDVM